MVVERIAYSLLWTRKKDVNKVLVQVALDKDVVGYGIHV